jgi:hypothetical protein
VPSFHECVRTPQNCSNAQLSSVVAYGNEFLQLVGKRDSHFIDSCWSHCQLSGDGSWTDVLIDGISAHDAVAQWYRDGFRRRAFELVDCKITTQQICNPTCK